MPPPIRRFTPAQFGGRSSKYNSVMVEVEGKKFHSKKEARKYTQLRTLQLIGEIGELETQVRLPLFVNGIKITTYVCDFRYVTKAGVTVYLDVKGMETDVFKIKKKLVLACLGIEIIVEH